MTLYGKKIDELYALNENGETGFFPVGAKGLWHSGIHIKTSNPITPAIDGDIVAYKLIEKYETVNDEKGEKLSSSFVLVKHSVDIQQADFKKKDKKSVIFFTLYMSLLPDSEYEIVKKYTNDFVVLHENITERTPFYRNWEFKINQDKAKSFYIYKNNETIFEGSTGYIADDKYITEKNNSTLMCCMDNSPGQKTAIESGYFTITNSSEKMVIKPKHSNVAYFSENTPDFAAQSARGIAKNVEINAYQDIVLKNGQRCVKVCTNSNKLTHNSKSGYIYFSHVLKNSSNSEWAYANEKITKDKVYFHSVATEIADKEKYYHVCTYSEFENGKNTLKNLSNIQLLFSNWNILLNKNQLVRDMDAVFSVEKTEKQIESDRLVVLCNQDYKWIKLNQTPDSKDEYFDFSFSDKIKAPVMAYVSESTLKILQDHIQKTASKDVSKIKLHRIKRTGDFMQSPENLHLNEKDRLGYISGELLVKADSNLQKTENSNWIMRAADVTLIKGPQIKMTNCTKNTPNYKNSSRKGILLFDNIDGNPGKILTESDGAFELTDAENFVRNSYGPAYKEIFMGEKKYFIKPDSKDCLKGKLTHRKNINVSFGKTVTLNGVNGSSTAPRYVNQNRCLGYGSEYDFSEKKQSKCHDVVVFTKNTDFTNNKEEKLVSSIKPGVKAKYVKLSAEMVKQAFPAGTVFSIEKKEEIFGYSAYKVKLSTIPLYFDDRQVSTSDWKKYKTAKDANVVWIGNCEITENGIDSSDSDYNADTCSIIINLLKNNFSKLQNITCEFERKNGFGNCSELKVSFKEFSGEYYLKTTDNLKLDEKNKTLTTVVRAAHIDLFMENPYAVQERAVMRQIEFDGDDGARIEYNGEKYQSVKNEEETLFIKESDVEKINLLDWKQFFQILDKSPSDDVVCDVQEEIIEQLELSAEEKKQVGDALKDRKTMQGTLNKATLKFVLETLRKMMVKHPLEWNADLYPKDLKDKLDMSPEEYAYLQESMKKVSIWKDISSLEGINGQKTLVFSHPLYFMNHLEKIKDVTAPFLLEKWGSRITGRVGNVYTLDGGKGKLLSNVEWYSQRDNVGDKEKGVYGYNMCQLTCLAMVMNAMGIKRKHTKEQFEDELYHEANMAGYGGEKLWKETRIVYGKVLEKYPDGLEYKEILPNRINNTKKQIDKGIPVILSMDYKPGEGHVIVIVGYTATGFIVNDPFGDNNTEYREPNGAFVEYDINKWEIGKKWAGYLTK